ncbi:helix-turn-helix domain-containing protein [Paenibacillus sp. N4]|uniref:response regulator transcription factor n=1 Tax=Paenibacillus vietnamensis TaxID=2590547 RepID=UPI001CD07B57|nr:helix-turn-helix domain-containing protein [Paenibacillus vietnamensis]MCA0753442.1 helix-turn-helix domain-containing protein [Paenibacillus vietnamensis]
MYSYRVIHFDYARKALRWGAFDYLTKPLDDAEFRACLDKVREQLQLHDQQAKDEEAAAPAAPQTVLQVSIQWVTDNLEEASLERAAEIANMHPVSFSRKFRAETGQTFIHFITEQRMEQAKRLLRNPVLKVHEIGRMVVYLDNRHFSETFKRHVGLRPSEYRDL